MYIQVLKKMLRNLNEENRIAILQYFLKAKEVTLVC